MTNIEKVYKSIAAIKNFKFAENEPKLEGISFKYKTVQFHLVDDSMEEIKNKQEFFGDVKIYAERFSLPGFGIKNDVLDGQEFQFEIIVGIDSKTDKETYIAKLKEVFDTIEVKHGVDVLGEPYKSSEGAGDEYYNLHKIIFHTTREDVFPKE